MGLIGFGAGWAVRAARRGARRSNVSTGLSDYLSDSYDADLEVRFERLSRHRSVLYHPEIINSPRAQFWFQNAIPQFATFAKVGSAVTLVGGFIIMLFFAITIDSFYALVVPYSSLGETMFAMALLLGIPGLGQIMFGQLLAPALMFWRINKSFRSEGWETKLLLREVRQMHREAKSA